MIFCHTEDRIERFTEFFYERFFNTINNMVNRFIPQINQTVANHGKPVGMSVQFASEGKDIWIPSETIFLLCFSKLLAPFLLFFRWRKLRIQFKNGNLRQRLDARHRVLVAVLSFS